MNKNHLSLTLILFFIFLAQQSLFAQFTVDANIRNRFEIRNGYQKVIPNNVVPAAFMHQRTRLLFAYNSENLKVRISPQDVRIWGDESITSSTGVFGDEASLSLYEGYSEIKFGSDHWISVGRQELKYDNQRLLSVRNWNYYGLAYDALVFKMNFEKCKLHVGTSWNSMGASATDIFYPANRIKSLSYVWYNRKIKENLQVSILHLSSGLTQTDTTNTLNFRHTTGFYSIYKTDKMQIWGNAYYQYGKNQQNTKVSALLVDAEASYNIKKICPGIGFSYLSGNSKTDTNQTTDQLFDLFYGARHGFFGHIDYFSNIPSSTKQGGLNDLYYFLKLNVGSKISINNTGHYFMLSQLNELTPNNKNLGYENDLTAKIKIAPWGTLDLGYLFILPTESLKTMHGVNKNGFCQFIHAQLLISPKLF